MVGVQLLSACIVCVLQLYVFQDSHWPVWCHLISMILASLSVIRGVSTIEPINKIAVPVLLGIVLFSFYWAIFLPYADVGIEKFFSPNWGKLVIIPLNIVSTYISFILYIANYPRWKSFVVFADRSVPQNFSSEIACAIGLAMQDYHPTANVFQRSKV